LGNLNTHRDLAAIISQASGAVALAVDYRLAPEHPFPAAVDDALTAYQFMHTHGPDGLGEAEALYINGESAGGGLSLATVLAARAAETPLPDAVAVVSSWTDLAQTGASYETLADVDIRISKAGSQATAALYLGDADPRNPLASPLYADLTGLPAVLLLVGDAEVLLDDTRRFTERARAAGVDVTESIWPEMFHVWHHQWATLPEAREAVEQIGAFLRAHGSGAA
jgi:acetyl esterase/lipase